jgi:hypothetical protein
VPNDKIEEEPEVPIGSIEEATRRYTRWKKAEMDQPITVCNCLQRLRKYRNVGLLYFLKSMEVDQVEPLGVFGITVPEEEDIKDAFLSLEDDFHEYADVCPWVPDENAVKLAEAMERFKTEDYDLGAFLEGEYDLNLEEFIEAAKGFTASAMNGIVRNVQGHRDTRGPLSSLDRTRADCSNKLFDMSDEVNQQTDRQETMDVYASPPVEGVIQLTDAAHSLQASVDIYFDVCKPWESVLDNRPLTELISGSLFSMENSVEWMLKLDEERKRMLTEGKKGDPHFSDRLEGTEKSIDHHAWDAIDNASEHKALVEEFLEGEWFQSCGRLEWKESIRQPEVGTHFQMIPPEAPLRKR